MRITNVALIQENSIVHNSAVDIDGSKIAAVYAGVEPDVPAEDTVDGQGCYLSPGFVDIHLHGGGGIEFMSAKSAEEVRIGCAAHAKHGTTTLLPTSFTGTLEQTLTMIRNVREAQKITKECTIAGVHLEGPFLSPKQAGAQLPEALKKPAPEYWEPLLNEWPEGIRIVGAAAELPGAMELGDALTIRGILATIAHSNADYDTCMEALQHGYRDITHIYSGCSMVHRKGGFRFGGVVEAGLLEDDFTVQVIADGCHLPPELLRLIYKNKGADRISLVTDALFAAAAVYPDGTVLRQANGMETVLEDGVMKMMDRQAFCGSIATMDRLVRNMVYLAGVPIWDAVKMASATPARVAGLWNKGRIQPGYDADLVLLNHSLIPTSVISMGHFL